MKYLILLLASLFSLVFTTGCKNVEKAAIYPPDYAVAADAEIEKSVQTTTATTTAVITTTEITTTTTTTTTTQTTTTTITTTTTPVTTETVMTDASTDNTESNVYMKGDRQALKTSPAGLTSADLTYEYSYDSRYYYFPSSGIQITIDDYIILCNCVAMEYGADWVPEWEMGLVAEVIFNRFTQWGYDSIRAVIVAPNQFENSHRYSGLTEFSGRVNSRVINAVNTYLAFPHFFDEGYTCFRGDGTWNYFW